jgi:hypothetical protein
MLSFSTQDWLNWLNSYCFKKNKKNLNKNPKAIINPDLNPDPKPIPKFWPNPDPNPEPKLRCQSAGL